MTARISYERICLALIYNYGGKGRLSELDPKWFSGKRRDIFTKLNEQLFSMGKIEPDLLTPSLDDDSIVEFGRCLDNAPGVEAIDPSVRRLRELYTMNTGMETLRSIKNEIDRGNYQGFLDGSTRLSDIASGTVEEYDPIASAVSIIDYHGDSIKTGIYQIDHSDPITIGEYILIAGRPSSGKTSLLTSIAHARVSNGLTVGVISSEMSPEQILFRMASQATGISVHHIRLGLLSDEEKTEVKAIMKQWKDKIRLFSGTKEVNAISGYIRSNRQVDLWIIDYIQLIASGISEDKIHANISAVSKRCQTLAKETKSVIFALSQLNRGYEQRTHPIPSLSDLRGSGSLEEDADRIWFMVPVRNARMTVIDQKKNRLNGSLYAWRMAYDTSTMGFLNLDEEPGNETELLKNTGT